MTELIEVLKGDENRLSLPIEYWLKTKNEVVPISNVGIELIDVPKYHGGNWNYTWESRNYVPLADFQKWIKNYMAAKEDLVVRWPGYFLNSSRIQTIKSEHIQIPVLLCSPDRNKSCSCRLLPQTFVELLSGSCASVKLISVEWI